MPKCPIIFELTPILSLGVSPSSSSRREMMLTIFHFSNCFPAMSDESAEKTFEQKRDETKMVGVLIIHEYRGSPALPFDFCTGQQQPVSASIDSMDGNILLTHHIT